MSDGERFPKFPSFPTLFTEKDAQRMDELKKLVREQEKAYGLHYSPASWEKKSALEKLWRGTLAAAYAPPKWLRDITPWEETGFIPEQANIYRKEKQAELQELQRVQEITERTPVIVNYITALALAGKLSGEEVQLYELIPELAPDASPMKKLNLTEKERKWFIDLNKILAGKSREAILEMYQEGFPEPKSIEELMELIQPTGLLEVDPRFIMSTVAFSKDIDQIGQALQMAYPPQTTKTPEDVLLEDIRTEAKKLGVELTGDWEKDIKALQEARDKAIAEKNVYFDTKEMQIVGEETPDTVLLTIRGNDVLMMGELVAQKDKETGELKQIKPISEVMLGSYNISEYPFSTVQGLALSDPNQLRQAVLWEGRSAKTEQLLVDLYGTQIDEEYINNYFQDNVPGRFVKGKWLPDALEDYWKLYWGGVGDLTNLVGAAFDRMGADGVANTLKKIGYEGQLIKAGVEMGEPNTPEWYAKNLTNMLPMMLGIIDVAIATGGGATSLVGAAGGGTLLKTVIGSITAGAIASVSEGALEGADAFQEAERRGLTPEEKDEVFDRVLRHNIGLLSMTNTAQFGAAFFLPGGTYARFLVKALIFGFEVASEGLEEGVQLAIIREAFGDVQEFDEEMWQSIKLGLAGGGVFGGIGVAYQSIQDRIGKKLTPAQKASIQSDMQDGMAQGKSYNEAKAKAYDNFASTPEGERIVTEATEEVMVEEQEAKVSEVPKMEEALDRALVEEIGRPLAITAPEAITPPTAISEETIRLVKESTSKLDAKRKVSPDIRRLRKELGDTQSEIDLYAASYNDAIEKKNRLERARVLPSEVFTEAERAKNLKVNLDKLYAQKKSLQGKIGILQKPPDERTYKERGKVALSEIITWFKVNKDEITASELQSIVSKNFPKKAEANRFLQKLTSPETQRFIREQSGWEAVITPPEVSQAEQYWNNLSHEDKLAKAIEVGIARTVADKPWTELTSVQQDRIQGVPPPKVVETKGLTPDEILNGKGINAEERLKQGEAAQDMHFARISPKEFADNREKAIKHFEALAEMSHLVDITKPLPAAFGYAWRLGDIRGYVDALPPEFTVSEEFKEGKFNESDTPMWNLQTQPATDAFAVIDNGIDIIAEGQALARKDIQIIGELGGLAQQNIAQGWLHVYRLLKQANDIGVVPEGFSKKQWHQDLFLLGQEIGKDDIVAQAEVLMERKEIKNILGKYSYERQWKTIGFFQGLRGFLGDMLAQQNAVREKLGRELIPEIDKYLPWMLKVNVWGNLMGFHLKPDFIMETASMPDFIKPNAPFNPRALARKAGMGAYEKVIDIDRLVSDYIIVATKDMFFTPVVLNAKAHVRELRAMGQEVPARYVEQWALERYAGVPGFWDRAWIDYVPAFITRPLAALNRSLTRAVFALNFQWNLIVQPSSMALTVLRYGTKNTIKGSDALWNPAARKQVRETYSHILKSRQVGSLVYQDMGTVVSQASILRQSRLDTVTDYLNFFTRWMELLVTDASIRAAYHDGLSKGMKEGSPELNQYAADGGAKTQSMYDPAHTPGWINTPLFRYFVRFQTFAFEALTRVREMANIKYLPKAGAYKTVAANSIEGQAHIQTRVKKFFEFMAAIWVINMIGDAAIDRKPWEMSSFLPAASLMMIGTDPYRTWNLPIPFRYVNELWRGFGGLVEYGNWKPIAEWALRWHFPAGIAASRTIQGVIAVIDEGKVTDISGDVMYQMEPEEYIKAIIMGTWQTETGREYRERMFEGVEITTTRVIKDLEKEEEKLGTVPEEEYEYYTLGNYLTAVNSKLVAGEEERLNLIEKLAGEPSMEWTGEPKYLVMDEASGFSPLTRFSVYCEEILWEEYKRLPTEAHLDYRRDHPYVDATLYFWERVRTVRSNKAKDILEELFTQFIVGNLKAHWRGLPEIPEDIKLLPE